jgi:hypothetical protein
MSYEPQCAICARPVNLQESKTDEHGHAVHENCYVWAVEIEEAGETCMRRSAGAASGRGVIEQRRGTVSDWCP